METRTSSLKQNMPGLLLLLSIPVMNIAYPLLNRSSDTVRSLVTDWDRSLPFVPAFAAPYLLWYFFVFLSLISLCFRDRHTYLRTLLAVDLGLLISYSFYLFFQSTVPRPELIGDDMWTVLTRFIYATDNPYNCFPSIHVLTSWLAGRGIWQSTIRSRLVKSCAVGMALLIIVSTLLIKQHVLLDAIAGIAVAEIVYYLSGRLTQSSKASGFEWPWKRFYLSMTRKKY